jgi:hypothetical protein
METIRAIGGALGASREEPQPLADEALSFSEAAEPAAIAPPTDGDELSFAAQPESAPVGVNRDRG